MRGQILQDLSQCEIEKYDEILNVGDNEIHVECLQRELEILKEEENNHESVLEGHRKLITQIDWQISEVMERNRMVLRVIEEEEEKCLKLSRDIEESNRNLQCALLKYSTSLNDVSLFCLLYVIQIFPFFLNFSLQPYMSKFLYNMPMENFNQYIDYINSYFMTQRKEQCESMSFLFEEEGGDITVNNIFSDALNELENRILNSTVNGVLQKIREERLKAGFDYLNSFNVDDILNISSIGR